MSPMLAAEGLTVRHGGVVAVDDVSFEVEPGEIVGLIGPNGAGKTSCLDALTGFGIPAGGRVRFGGRDVTAWSPHRRARHGFVRTFQGLDLFEDLTVRQNLEVGASTPTWRDTIADAFRFRHRDDPAVEDALEVAGIADLADRMPPELSNGQRHLVALARALASGPELLLLDEPAAGLDEGESAELGRLLRTLPERGITVLLVDHDMPLVLGTCDRIQVLDLGRRIAGGTPAEIRNDPLVIAAYLGAGDRSGTDGAEDAPDAEERR